LAMRLSLSSEKPPKAAVIVFHLSDNSDFKIYTLLWRFHWELIRENMRHPSHLAMRRLCLQGRPNLERTVQ
jgi:hypothetical protein